MSERQIGTCSLCGGAVTVPSIWLGIISPTPTCSSCGAVPEQAHGPVIPMRPAPRPCVVTTTGTGVEAAKDTCTHGVMYDSATARSLPSYEIRRRFPRLDGPCPLGCGFRGIGYASHEHYVAGDW